MRTKNTYSIIYIVLLTIYICSCTNNKGYNIPTKKIKAAKKINILGDSTYFSMIDGIRCWDNNFFIIQSEAHRIVMLDTNLHLINSFGQKGKGPGDFIYPTDLCKNNNHLYVADGGASNISIFHYRKNNYYYDSQFKMKFNSVRESMCFTIFDGQIYTISPLTDRPLQVLTLQGEAIKKFGKKIAVPTKHYYRNSFYIDSSPEVGIIAVSRTEPIIRNYNKEGELLSQIDLSELKILQKTLEINNKYYETADLNSCSNIFSSICLQKDQLYVKMVFRNKEINNTRNKILVLKVKENKIVPEKILELENSLIDIICVSNDHKKLIAFDDICGEISIFNL